MTQAIIIHPDLKTDFPHSPPPNMRTPPNMPPLDMRTPAEKLAEACSLAKAIALDIIHHQVVPVTKKRAATLLGSGAVQKLAEIAEEWDNPLFIINASLRPIQQRNLEMALKSKVIDRTALILEIFGARASSRTGRLQVEMAALSFQRSRLVRSWTHLERQRGGGGFLGGPGERQIELDKRMLTDKIKQIKKELREVTRTRGLQRRHRQKSQTPIIALVGYTNVGKTTLFNRLTGADMLAKNMLFATLDPTLRAATLPSGREVICSDTVGFISALPTALIEAFKSTLEEVRQADLIVHVHDLASPHMSDEAQDVAHILSALGIDAEDQKSIHVFNKMDKWEGGDMGGAGQKLICSAVTGEGVGAVLEAIEAVFAGKEDRVKFYLSPEQGEAMAWLYQHGQVHHSIYEEGGKQCFEVTLSKANKARFASYWPNITQAKSAKSTP